MKIIDFRFRPNTTQTLDGLINSCIFREGLLANGVDLAAFAQTAQEMPEIAKGLQEFGVMKAVIVGRDAETTYGFTPNNDGVRDFVKGYPDLFIGFAGLDPHKGMASIYELERLVKEEGFKGAALDPIYAQLTLNHKKYYPIYAKCCELDIPIIITSGPARFTPDTVMDHASPLYIDEVAKDFPALKIVVSHGGYPWVNEMIGVAFRNKNVYMELSEYEQFPASGTYIEAANTILADKIMFASAHPFVNYRDAVKMYQELPFKDEIREKLMWQNAQNVLGLS